MFRVCLGVSGCLGFRVGCAVVGMFRRVAGLGMFRMGIV